MRCQNCNNTVTSKSKFCPHCGERIILRSSSKKKQSTARNIPLSYAVGFVGLGLLLGFIIFKSYSNSTSRTFPSVSNINSSSLIQSPAVSDVAKEFMCFCGSCTDRLDECSCEHKNGAREVKSFIAQKLSEGHEKPHIVEMVRSEYSVAINTNLPTISPGDIKLGTSQ
jgi:predicted RNA-binding Zn-ribbon protein involved in translation (DUF1610 family)